MKSAEEEIGKILPKAPFIEILQSVENVVSINFENEKDLDPRNVRSLDLPGDQGGILLKISRGPGPTHFNFLTADLSELEKTISLPDASSGTTWILLSLNRADMVLNSEEAGENRSGVNWL